MLKKCAAIPFVVMVDFNWYGLVNDARGRTGGRKERRACEHNCSFMKIKNKKNKNSH